MRKLLQRLRVFKRLRLYREAINEHTKRLELLEQNVSGIGQFIQSREPCDVCSHHRYRQKTLHNPAVK